MHVAKTFGGPALALVNRLFHINFSKKPFLEQVAHDALKLALSDLIVSPYSDLNNITNIHLEAKNTTFIQSLVIPEVALHYVEHLCTVHHYDHRDDIFVSNIKQWQIVIANASLAAKNSRLRVRNVKGDIIVVEGVLLVKILGVE